ncbi:uncharacterized protein LOC126733543 [Anthonomus grandis grandis]|uniref:uncharacterized protein LOC126733543 n=1 Tax=Anthonomus grandis grandis TaxID=2921223 RepID=UPI002165C470|nr:uncharacterized protein LOC126733543 [Anthonomus grandis grandis]
MCESLVPFGPPKRRKSPRRHPPEEQPAPSSSTNGSSSTVENPNTKKIPMLIRGIGVHQVIPKEATRDVLTGKVPFYLVDDKDGVTLFPAKHIFTALKLDQEKIEQLEDYSCLGAHERFLAEKPRRKEGMGYRRKYISPELIYRGIYLTVDLDIRIKALMLLCEEYLNH